MWLKWRIQRNRYSDSWNFKEISDYIVRGINSLKEDSDAVVDFLEEEDVIKIPEFSVTRWTTIEWEVVEYPPVEFLFKKVEILESCIKSYEREIKEYLQVIEKIKSKGE